MKDFLQSIPVQDESLDDPQMETLQDLMDNGGKIPPEVGNSLVLAAVRKTYREVKRSGNVSRHNQVHLWALTAIFLGTMAAALWLRSTDIAAIHASFPGIPFILLP